MTSGLISCSRISPKTQVFPPPLSALVILVSFTVAEKLQQFMILNTDMTISRRIATASFHEFILKNKDLFPQQTSLHVPFARIKVCAHA